MKLTKSFFITFVFAISLFCFLQIPSAQAGLVPCGLTSDVRDKCTLCHLFTGIDNIIDWGMKILVVVALVAIVAGAIMYIISAGNNTMMESAKNVIKQALWGVVIVLGAWVIVNTTMWLMATKLGNVGITSWSEFDCEGGMTQGTVTAEIPIDANADGTCPSGYRHFGNSQCLSDTGAAITCSNFTYSAWTPATCTAGSTQTRTATGTPAGCTGGTPGATSQSCPTANTCTSFTYSAWAPSPCTEGSTQTRTATGLPAGCTGGTPGSISQACPGAQATATEESVRSRLADAGITINRDSCCYGEGCTCVGGLREETIAGGIDFKQKCDAAMASIGGSSCTVVFSGGNEDGVHSEKTEINHVNGYKIDIRPSPEVNAYITTYFKELPEKRSDGATGYEDPETGVIYYREGNHWDVAYNTHG